MNKEEMKLKKFVAWVLSAALLLSLLPVTAFAGGGTTELIWQEDFSEDPAEWTILDGNNDGYSFGWNAEEGCLQSGAIAGMGLLPPKPQSGEDYLISPTITLRENENVLTYDACALTDSPDVLYDVFVCPAGIPLDEELIAFLREPVYYDACYSWGSGTSWRTRKLDLTAYAGRNVRLVFRQRADAEGCAMKLDNIRIYRDEPDEILDKVTAFNVPAPRVGKQVSECRESEISFPAFANYELIPGSLTYYRIENEQSKVFNGTFARGEEYTLSFEVMAKPGSTVSEDGVASVDGKWAFFKSESSEVVLVEIYFNSLNEILDSVSVTVPPALAGREPVPNDGSVAEPDKCVLTDYAYLELNEEGESVGPLMGSPFELNRSYQIAVLLDAALGWEFTEHTKVSINGRNAQYAGSFERYHAYSVIVKVDHVLFTDVKPNHWFVDAVRFCYENGYMAGTGDGYSFSPNMPFSRAMFVTVLARIDGEDISGFTGSHFSDVKPGRWYAAAVEWAYQNGYAGGTGDGKFSPDAAVTRETLAVFFYNYTMKKWNAVDDEDWVDLSAYPDGDKVSGWAKEAMRWAVYHGLISGAAGTDGSLWLKPKSTATRAEVAQMVKNYCDYVHSLIADD